jgi:hypothetical protein
VSVAWSRALKLRTVYDINDFARETDLDEILSDLGSPTVLTNDRALGPLPEVLVDGRSYLGRAVDALWRLWLKAELIAHLVLHQGDQTMMPMAAVGLQERQANELAGWLIFGDLYERWGCGVCPVTYVLVAEYARVPVECVERWWAIVGAGTATWPAFNYA